MAALLASARPILDADHDASIDRLRRLIDGTGQKLPPPDMSRQVWQRLKHGRFCNRYLRAIDQALNAADRLRMRTTTTAAAMPTSRCGADRARSIPQLFWPDWTGRLLPVNGGFRIDRLRGTLAVLLTVPGDNSRGMDSHARAVNPTIGRSLLTTTLQGFARIGSDTLTDVLTLLGRLAAHLDEHGSPIDYQRRREQVPAELIDWEQWREMCCSVGAHPGESHGRGRIRHARRHLHQLLTGDDLSYHRHRLALRNGQDRSGFVAFTAALPSPLRAALHTHAEKILADLGIDEPLVWSPPAELATGLTLPGIDTDDLDIDVINRVVIEENRTARDAADLLGVQVEHIRLALERLDRPQRHWGPNAAPAAWLVQQRASAIFTPEYLEREYIQAGRTLRDIAQETGIGRHIIARLAKQAGLDLRKGRDPFPIDPEWLRGQYSQRLRSTSDIAAELGVEQMVVNQALHRFGIPARAQGVGSRTEMIASGNHLPPRIRAAVTGTLHGWKRLHRFQITMAFPTIRTAADYLGTDFTGIVVQLRRLERDIGATLFHRAATNKPLRPTPAGQALLDDLTDPQVQHDLAVALRKYNEPPMPSPHTVAEAHRIASQPARKPQRPKPFEGIALERIRMTRTTRILLEHLAARPNREYYSISLATETGLPPGSVADWLRQFKKSGWLSSRPEDDAEWLAGAPPGCGPGRRRIYYRLTSDGHRAATRELATPRRRRQNRERIRRTDR